MQSAPRMVEMSEDENARNGTVLPQLEVFPGIGVSVVLKEVLFGRFLDKGRFPYWLNCTYHLDLNQKKLMTCALFTSCISAKGGYAAKNSQWRMVQCYAGIRVAIEYVEVKNSH